MHEITIVNAILDEALKVAETHGGRPVESLRVRIGRLRQIVPDLVCWSFDILKKATLAEKAVLECEEVELHVRCEGCSTTFRPDDIIWACPECGAFGGEVLEGNELILHSVVLGDAIPRPVESQPACEIHASRATGRSTTLQSCGARPKR
ncbi:MAG: hydrogenase maturation nickel metallochaperone HypA [Planctomycetota bacterium]|nr:hydrogenase maturation nickel metallochaperone HypA [Planctomycetota bacterium]